MKVALKIQLLKRKFLSAEYINDFIRNYQDFIETGLIAFKDYKIYRKNNPQFIPSQELKTEEFFWEGKVIPNFTRMRASSESLAEKIKNNSTDITLYLDGLAGDFRGLSRGFDGVEENFMDIVDPEVRKKYLGLYKLTSDCD